MERSVRTNGGQVLKRIMRYSAKHCPAQMAALNGCAKSQGGFENCTEENKAALDCGSRHVIAVVQKHNTQMQAEKAYNARQEQAQRAVR